MLDVAYTEGLSRTIAGIYVTYDSEQGYGVFKPGHGQTLAFRPEDQVITDDGREADVIGYTSFATHTVALQGTDRRQFSAHESTLTLHTATRR